MTFSGPAGSPPALASGQRDYFYFFLKSFRDLLYHKNPRSRRDFLTKIPENWDSYFKMALSIQ